MILTPLGGAASVMKNTRGSYEDSLNILGVSQGPDSRDGLSPEEFERALAVF